MYFERKAYLKELISAEGNGMIKIITGIRRCGKSFLLFNIFRKHLLERGVAENHIIPVATHYQSRLAKNVEGMIHIFGGEEGKKLTARNVKIIREIAERTESIERGVEDAQLASEPTARNSKRFPVKARNEVKWETYTKKIQIEARVMGDLSKAADANYLEENAGKLMTIRKVKFSSANGKTVWAANDETTNQSLKDAVTGQWISSNTVVVRTSGYARFANAILPDGAYDITGIFTRYNNVWQIIIRNTDDLSPSVLSIFKEAFDESQGEFTTENIKLAEGVSYAWKWASAAYGMKASGYVNGTNVELQSRLKSPAINLSSVKSATLKFDQAINFSSDMTKECKVQVSTDGKTWTDLKVAGYPTKNGWDFVTSTADLTKYCGKTIYIGFLYSSSTSAAPTWEVKNFVID